METSPKRARSLAAEATTFWLIVSGVMIAVLAVSIAWAAGPGYFALTLALAIIDVGLAYLSWRQRTWSFLASLVFALIVAALFFGILYSSIGAFLLLLQFQIIFFSYRAHTETKVT